MKSGIILTIAALAIGATTAKAMDQRQMASVGGVAAHYAFAQFATANSYDGTWDRREYGAIDFDNKGGFSLVLDGHGGRDEDTVNVAWACDTPSVLTFTLDTGSLPGTWTIEADGRSTMAPSPLAMMRNPNAGRRTQRVLLPVTLSVSGVDISTPAGEYAGTLKMTIVGVL